MLTTDQRLRLVRSLFAYTVVTTLVTFTCAVLAREAFAAVSLGGIGVTALLALGRRTWCSLALVAACAGAITLGAIGAAPWWALAPAVAGGIAAVAVGQLLWRRDRVAAAALVAMALAGGSALALSAHALAPSVLRESFLDRAKRSDPPPFEGDEYERARVRGKAEALADIAAGRLRLFTYGLPSPAEPEYAALLRARLGVELERVAGCAVDSDVLGRADGHDSVMAVHLRGGSGADVLDRLWIEAQSRHALARAW